MIKLSVCMVRVPDRVFRGLGPTPKQPEENYKNSVQSVKFGIRTWLRVDLGS